MIMILASQVKDTPTREIKFQKLFAQYAKGSFPLNTYAMDINIFKCTQRLNKLLKEIILSYQYQK